MTTHRVVSPQSGWPPRLLLKKRKPYPRRDELSRKRRGLPGKRVEKTYVFDTPAGGNTCRTLFAAAASSSCITLMFAPDWEAGCKSCHSGPTTCNGIVPPEPARRLHGGGVARSPEELEASGSASAGPSSGHRPGQRLST